MKTTIWIPKPGDTVRWNEKTCTVISCNMGGKCKIKKMLLPDKGKMFKDIDVSELTKL